MPAFLSHSHLRSLLTVIRVRKNKWRYFNALKWCKCSLCLSSHSSFIPLSFTLTASASIRSSRASIIFTSMTLCTETSRWVSACRHDNHPQLSPAFSVSMVMTCVAFILTHIHTHTLIHILLCIFPVFAYRLKPSILHFVQSVCKCFRPLNFVNPSAQTC